MSTLDTGICALLGVAVGAAAMAIWNGVKSRRAAKARLREVVRDKRGNEFYDALGGIREAIPNHYPIIEALHALKRYTEAER